MFDDLPEDLKRQVHDFLKANDFPAAKAVHDNWMRVGETREQLSEFYQFHEEKLCALVD